MADDLKRVGLVFKEDGAVDFRKSLQEVNVELNKNYNQFRLVQSQWDNSTKSSEKLKAQQEYLGNAIEIQGDRVKVLRRQLEELENVENKDITAIKKKQNELTNAEIKLKNYEKQLKDVTNQLNDSGKAWIENGEKIEKFGSNVEKAGKKISVFSTATAGAFVASAKTAIDFEDAFTGVEKTVDETVNTSFADLRQGIRDMAKEIPSSATEIAGVAEAAGQLGISADDILSFTRVMIDLGNSTNLSAEEAASSLAKFANITKMSADDYSKLGSVIVDLGNNFATTEADIVDMATKLASTGELTGLTEPQIMALATAMSSVGIEAEAGGSAMSKLLKKIQVAVETGSGDLKDFASVAGMTADEFKQAFEKDAVGALSAFLGGLNDTERNGKSAIGILDDMGITEVRLSNTVLALASNNELLNDAVETANSAWEDNTALTNEANKRYDTLKSKLTVAVNKFKDMGITLGNKLMPYIEKAVNWVDELVKRFDGLNDEQLDMIINIGAIIAVIGPAIVAIGKLTTGIGSIVKVFGTVKTAFEVAKGAAEATTTSVKILSGIFTAVTGPIGIACLAIGAAVAGIAVAVKLSEKDSKEAFSNMGNAANDFISGIDNAKSHLSDFNSTLFVSSQEQQELQMQMDEVQQGITNICKTASDERRGYTQGEITQLDEYFVKLRELNQREIEIQQAISDAITQQAVTNSQTFQGTLEEYKAQSQEWIKTAEEQKTKTIELIDTQSIETVALLNQRYGEQANMQNEAYATEYNNIMAQKQSKIDAANNEVAEVSQAYANGYLQRAMQNDGFYAVLSQYNSKVEEENNRHNQKIQDIENGHFNVILGKRKDARIEENKHNSAMKDIWNQMYKNMSEEQEKELGIWLANVAQTQLYGGQIDDETQKIVDSILESYDSMPKGTRESMKNAMQPMLEEMQNKEPSLFAKASGIANGILSRLKKAFDIHSPSRKTREIFKNVMFGMEKGIEEQEKDLYNKTENVAKNVMDDLNEIQPNAQLSYSFSRNSDYNGVDYNKMSIILTNAFLTALNKCKLTLDEDGFARIVKDELYKVV